MDNKEYASAYAIAKICGYSGSFDDFKKLYDQYYSDIIKSLPEEKPEPFFSFSFLPSVFPSADSFHRRRAHQRYAIKNE